MGQLGLTGDYTPAMLKDDMLKYLNSNADFFTVSIEVPESIQHSKYGMVTSHIPKQFLPSLLSTFNFPQVLLETNLSACQMTIDDYTKEVMNLTYHGYDLTLLVLSKLLKVVIALIHPDYIWMSNPDVNILEALVVIVYDDDMLLQGTGTLLVTISMLFVYAVHGEWLLMLSLMILIFQQRF